ncbi:GYD domain-containing protein [Micromonospora sp. NPDC049799]|uniref:GYD domain-containing protein n=1 Tax=Micromonospora sp. NPDC049799 TaxID=3154741 RepID=UPI0033F71ABA
MARFLFTATYTAEGIKGLGKDGGTTRAEVVQALIENAGGRVEALYFAFGEHDLYIVCELPDPVAAAALGIQVRAAGGVEASVVSLLTPAEIDAAAGVQVAYQPPGR